MYSEQGRMQIRLHFYEEARSSFHVNVVFRLIINLKPAVTVWGVNVSERSQYQLGMSTWDIFLSDSSSASSFLDNKPSHGVTLLFPYMSYMYISIQLMWGCNSNRAFFFRFFCFAMSGCCFLHWLYIFSSPLIILYWTRGVTEEHR